MEEVMLIQFIAKPNHIDSVRDALIALSSDNFTFRVHQLKTNPAAFYALTNWTDLMPRHFPMEYLVAPPTVTFAHMISRPDTSLNKRIAVPNSLDQVTLIPFFTIKKKEIDAVRNAHLSVVDTTRAEHGCIDYDLYQSLDDPAVMFFYENWTDQAALSKHMNTPNFYRVVRGEVDPRLLVPWTALSMTMIAKDMPASYWPLLKPLGTEEAPRMSVKQIGENEYVLVFRTGDEVMSGLLGAVSSASFGWYDLGKRAYKINHVDKQLELTSLIGNITNFNGKPASTACTCELGHGRRYCNWRPRTRVIRSTHGGNVCHCAAY